MADAEFMRLALRWARRGRHLTSPNPMVGAVLVRRGQVIGRGWHRRAGLPHAEIEALLDAQRRGHSPAGATLYVTLEPCCTHGRTPPCTEAIIAAGVRRVVAGTTDPNPKHAGRGFAVLRSASIEAELLASATGPSSPATTATVERLARECSQLNEVFNHWIVQRTPFVTVKAAMTLDGKIATAAGESKWITGPPARAFAMRLRAAHDAILVGINTVLADDPSLTLRGDNPANSPPKPLRRLVLDSRARTPLTAKVVTDEHAALTTIVVGRDAPERRVAALGRRVRVWKAPGTAIALRWLLRKLGAEGVSSLLVEGGGEVGASFLAAGLAHRVAFFYAPKILGGRTARRGVAGEGAAAWHEVRRLSELRWQRLGPDLLLTARVA